MRKYVALLEKNYIDVTKIQQNDVEFAFESLLQPFSTTRSGSLQFRSIWLTITTRYLSCEAQPVAFDERFPVCGHKPRISDASTEKKSQVGRGR